MAKETTQDIAIREAKILNKEAKITESYFAGLMWSNPFDNYAVYGDTISQDEFVHSIWGFYFDLGRRMYEDGIKSFDDISVVTKVKEYGLDDEFESHGGFEPIDDAVSIVKEHSDNIEAYYEKIKKTYTMKQLYLLFGDKVFVNKDKYDWKRMNRDQLAMFWNDKLNQISLSNVNRYEAENLYIDGDEFIKKLEEDSSDMLPYYKSTLLNSISTGVPRGHVTMIGGFGGTGKSSITAEKYVMSCIANQEKMIVVLNEEDAQAFRQKIVLSILWNEFGGEYIDRKRMVNGKLKEEDKLKIKKAFAKLNELINGNESLIKVIFMEKYVISDLEKIVRFWANRGYHNLLIDTHKVSDESKHDKRWETFVEDMKTIYRMTRKNAGGMNLRTVVTFQLADGAIRNRYLDYEAIGEGKASKNEASIMYMFRTAWSDEYEGEKNELECYKLVKNKKTGEWDKKAFKLQKGKTYYLWFTPKNRFGHTNDNGQAVMVIEPMFHVNHFKEIGWCQVANDKSRRAA
ncbi:hypothetical protein IEN91_05360 [Bacillus velezensis]|uniref:ATPase domain-containing protein n=1 Tax=Bacillus velezensis TaxID=492670 RepID=UPI0018C6719D|nr:ATPase domain-containing protein [Bacillus velezensis]QPK89867.1 hypothetical protein IEN91_05360 [Bacillus velezensis]